MSRPKFFRDPIHGQIRFEAVDLSSPVPKIRNGKFTEEQNCNRRISWAIRKLIGTREFQRLRLIRQNGLTNFVFHGAEHSRFAHSMGVFFIAREMHNNIIRNMDEKLDPDIKLAICVAALLHDIGHGPFSHSLESVYKKVNDGKKFKHEEMTVRFIEAKDSEINKILREIDPQFPNEIVKFISTIRRGPEDHWKYKIVSSQLDADRLDYLIRDLTLTGLQGHGFDLPRLLDMLAFTGDQKTKIGVNERGLIAVESFLVALDQMYRAVYYHHSVISAGFLLKSCFYLAFKLYKDGDKSIFQGPQAELVCNLLEEGSNIGLQEYSKLGDHTFWSLIDSWTEAKNKTLANLAKRMMGRELFKTIDLDPNDHAKTLKLANKARRLTKKAFSDIVDDETVDLFVGIEQSPRTSYRRYDWYPENPGESIFIVSDHNSEPIEVYDGTTITKGLKERIYMNRLIFPEEIRKDL